ncbi:MAG: DUF1735 and LamG domain-containing protein, partial [Clostridia bacterium]|nr:DUF1735 and LamG domain-containing protein [Clostridia bacterium]
MKKYTILLFALALCLAGCKMGPDYGDAVYITGTLSSSTVRFTVDGQSSMGITVSSSAKTESDVTINLAVQTDMIDSYNASTGRNCLVPPAGSYSLEGTTVTIQSGQVQSTALKLDVDSEQLSEGVSYCIPISITSVTGGGDLKVLESARTAYILLTKVITIKVAYLQRSGSFTIDSFAYDDSPVKALEQMTLEMKVYAVSFPTTANSASGISSLCGCEENFLFRFGDGAGNPTNKLQIAKASIGTASDPDSKDHYDAWITEFDTGHWIHFAATYDGTYLKVYIDGEEAYSIETKGGTINLSTAYNGTNWNDTFSIGRSAGYARYFDGYVSECRVWNVARTATELEDGICYVDPTSDGLVAYWRFNGEIQDDGTVRDETGHGYDAVPYG